MELESDEFIPIFTELAQQDLIEILDYYENISSKFILKLIQDIEERINDLKFFPMRGRIIPELEKNAITDYREL
ncbi:MAG: type II toxin-antitoxin system RelE/ParE family toxin, partial [Spirochaetales bacterium]|nr:type II toxin-antitoxin system RelE/ParE family toxin [Spirochaetales bacterium]